MLTLLFDIDGTLICTSGAGMAAFRAAFEEAFQIENAAEVTFSGRTDRSIGRMMFEHHGVKDCAENWERLRAGYLRNLPGQLLVRQGKILPGIKALLNAVHGRPDVAVGLLTGNVREGASRKLGHFDINHFFPFGGFGDTCMDRDDVAAEALRAAQQHVGGNLGKVWVLGDTPLDIRCARHIQANVLAVTTGLHGRDELLSHSPDLLMDSLEDTNAVLAALSA